MLRRGIVSLAPSMLFAVLAAAGPGGPAAADDDWVAAMRRVHARFSGRKGTFAQFGDSITVSQAFWACLRHTRKNAPPEMEQAFRRVQGSMRPECWDWKGPAYGNEGGTTTAWARQHVGGWLRKLNPETALIMFGSNDVTAMSVREYQTRLEDVVRRCLANGTVVILSTPPPRHGFVAQTEEFARAVRDLARRERVPLVDYHAEILKRRPRDWDGAAEQFRGFEGYDVPTLLARDGVHPSHPRRYGDDYSTEALRSCGYSLRNYLVLLRYADVLNEVLAPEKRGAP